MAGKWRAIALLSACEVLALGLWFSMSAVVPALRAAHDLSDWQVSLFTSAVGIGFVCGTLTSAMLGLADRFDPRRVFLVAAWAGAAANAAILAMDPASPMVIVLRFVTGAAMAGVYPVGMKMAAGWAKADTGLLVGLLVGALTLGSAAPHLFNALGGVDWRLTLVLASAAALLAGLLILGFRLGPNHAVAPRFRPALAVRAVTDPATRLANLGYFGHMWELYAMWGWIGVFLQASFGRTFADPGSAAFYAKLATFAVIGAGALGSLLGGLVADRMGRTTLTMAAMAISGGCALVAGFLFGGNPHLLIGLCLIWGVAVVADSAQFSSCVIELNSPDTIGTMLTVQTCAGFLLTFVTIHLIPPLVAAVGWQYAFIALAPGPFLGVLAMARLRAHPASTRIAGGRR